MAEESLRYVIVHGEARFSRTEYICGRNSRSEYRNGPFLVDGDPKRPETMQLEFGPRRALIQNRDLGYQFDIDLESRVYTAFELHEYRRPGSSTPQVESLEPSGRTVHVRTETIDTGERKEMFGYTARRVTIRTTYRYSPDDDAGSLDSESSRPANSGESGGYRTRRPCRSGFACGWAGGISNINLGIGDEHVSPQIAELLRVSRCPLRSQACPLKFASIRFGFLLALRRAVDLTSPLSDRVQPVAVVITAALVHQAIRTWMDRHVGFRRRDLNHQALCPRRDDL
jgi:hypothetical protein